MKLYVVVENPNENQIIYNDLMTPIKHGDDSVMVDSWV